MLAVVGVVSTGHAHPGKTADSERDTGAAWLTTPASDADAATAAGPAARTKLSVDTEAATVTVRLLRTASKLKEGCDRPENVIKASPETRICPIPYLTAQT